MTRPRTRWTPSDLRVIGGPLPVVVAVLALLAASLSAVLTSAPAAAATPGWQVPATAATLSGAAGTTAATARMTLPNGVVVTYSGGAGGGGASTTVWGAGTLGDRGYLASDYTTPALASSTPAVTMNTWMVNNCPASGTCSGLGTFTISFSQAVTDPVLSFGGICGYVYLTDVSGNITRQSEACDTLRLTTAGPTLAAVSGSNLTVTGGTTIQPNNANAGPSCSTTATGAVPAQSTAACGQVQVLGTVTSLTFTVGGIFTPVDSRGGVSCNNSSICYAGNGTAVNTTGTWNQDQFSVVAVVPDLSLSLQKSVSPSTVTAAGQSVTYSFLVTNTGGLPLSNIRINETAFSGTGTMSAVTCPPGALAPGASTTCTATYTLTQADINAGKVTNTATAQGTPPGVTTPVVSTRSTATVTAAQSPAITIVKSSTTGTISQPGQHVPYSFLVTNTGNVTLTAVKVVDTQVAPATQANLSTITCPTTTLAPGASTTCTATYTVTQSDLDNGKVVDTAVANGTPPSGGSVTSPPSQVSIPSTQSVRVDKTWIIKNPAGTVIGTFHLPSQSGDTAANVPTGFTAAPTISGRASASFGSTYGGYQAGQPITIGETSVTVPAGCTVSSQQLTAVNGAVLPTPTAVPAARTLTATPSPNTFTITNTVTCTQTLTLTKQVAYGSLAPTSWTLSATAPADSLAGPSGATGTSGTTNIAVSPQVAYTLAESSTVAGSANYIPTGAGWTCAAGSTSVPVLAGAVSVGYGQAVTCTITNTTAKVSVLKHIHDPAGGLTAAQFRLTLTPSGGFGSATTVDGSETASAANTFEVRPGTTYTLTEQSLSSTTAYLLLGMQRSTDGGNTWTAVDGNQLTPTAGTQTLYRLVNQSAPAIALPLTGGLGTDRVAVTAIAFLLLAALLIVWQIRRRRRFNRH